MPDWSAQIFCFLNFMVKIFFLFFLQVSYIIFREFYSPLVEIQIQNPLQGSFKLYHDDWSTGLNLKTGPDPFLKDL